MSSGIELTESIENSVPRPRVAAGPRTDRRRPPELPSLAAPAHPDHRRDRPRGHRPRGGRRHRARRTGASGPPPASTWSPRRSSSPASRSAGPGTAGSSARAPTSSTACCAAPRSPRSSWRSVGMALKIDAVRPWIFGVIPATGAGLLLGRYAVRRVLHRARRDARCMSSVLVVGSEAAVADLVARTRRVPHHGWTVTAACTSTGGRRDRRRAGRRRPRRRRPPRARARHRGRRRRPDARLDAASACTASPGTSRAPASSWWSTRASWRSPARACTSPRSTACRCCASPSPAGAARPAWPRTSSTARAAAAAGPAPRAGVPRPRGARPPRRRPGVLPPGARRPRRPDRSAMIKFRSMVVDADQQVAPARRRQRGRRPAVQDEARPAHHPRRRRAAPALARRAPPAVQRASAARCRWSAPARRCQREVGHLRRGRPPQAPRPPGHHRPLAGQRPHRPHLGGVGPPRPALRRELVARARPARSSGRRSARSFRGRGAY